MPISTRAYPMAFRGDTRHLRLVSGYGLGAYRPAPSLIKTDTPQQALFFRPALDMTVWSMCKQAYGKDNVFKGIKAVTNSAWNKSHIYYSRKGYENYGFDGPQMEKRYDPNNPLSTRGSGSAYPTFWIPPLDTLKEPEQVFVIEPPITPPVTPPDDIPPMPPDTPPEIIKYYKGDKGDPGAPGSKGERGDPGAPGRPPTTAEINAAVTAYFKANPPPGIDPAMINKAVAEYLKANPPPGVDPNQIKTAVENYLINNPPAGVDPAQIKKAVEEYLIANPPAGVTEEGINKAVVNYFKLNPPAAGPPGKMGPPGPAADPALVKSIVLQWLKDNPPPGVDPAQIKNAVEQYLIANPPEAAGVDWAELKKYVQAQISKIPTALGGASIWPGLATFAIFGLLIKGSRK